MPGTLDPVRPITLDRDPGSARAHRRAPSCARRWSGWSWARLSRHPAQAREPAADQRLQAARRRQRRGACSPTPSAQRGVWTISAGNAGQGVAYAARKAGVPCTVVAIETAPASKLERMRALGAQLVPVPYDVAWKALEERAYPGVEGTFVHPFDDHNFIAGHATMGLEILEDAPDTAAVIAGIGGGGLITGVGSAIKALKPDIKVWGAEPETAAPLALSLATGSPQVFEDWKAVVRRRRRRPERLPAHVGADAAAGGRLHRGHASRRPGGPCGSWPRRRGSSRRGGRAPAGGGADRQGRPGPDRRHRLRRQHRPQEVRRADRIGAGLT